MQLMIGGAPDAVPSGAREQVLLLCHRIPYPPDKGDKIRSHRWLTSLAARYRVHLGAFVDDPNDWAHAERLRTLCAEVCLRPLPPVRARLRGLPALLTTTPLTVACYADRQMAAWVRRLCATRTLSRVIVFSSAMAQYALLPEAAGLRRVIDYVDVDADKWRQYAERKRAPMSWLYAREARCLLAYDARVARAFAASLFVSAPEAALFLRMTGAPGSAAVPNGVDSAYFAPMAARPSPFNDSVQVLVFTGAMDYWANVDAVRWFAAEVWPLVRQRMSSARFYVVGARPTREVSKLVGEGIVVTGRVPDVRPYLQHAAAVVAPMRIARGIQNKVLEGMAMGRVVVTTPMGLEGIDAEPGRHLLVADEPADMAEQLVAALQGRHARVGTAARQLIGDAYDWRIATERFLAMVAGEPSPEQVQA
ncbi:MAG: TIGR03087 family PEP-CTERM/XrtA system glycosyltransferase [Thiohalocapsa sp.]|jgi:sugar transferase (PEP-CTERM/EpsH1 system associated)|uniref:TIGR03087 family PEP-CTERM/XrtA system glycosyltransferase n=1 Tax=Thiohalocapsa sp. TaxID=2497641 RepID=UPI0025F75C67|nr:TIGR03087 family PEP-CTERM/XrtA system glycosyltransferase [Thiohalocapsa sp.]MCG6940119.1 TIGR03087 family PEP-CTERM/XrtA system glycosyltransferase [Thiohalocapsa sp.]